MLKDIASQKKIDTEVIVAAKTCLRHESKVDSHGDAISRPRLMPARQVDEEPLTVNVNPCPKTRPATSRIGFPFCSQVAPLQ